MVARAILVSFVAANFAVGQFTGAESCRPCHPKQSEQQAKSGHARSLTPLEAGRWAFGAGSQAITFVTRVDAEHYREEGLSRYTKGNALARTPGHSSDEGQLYRTFNSDAAILRCFQCHSTGTLKMSEKFEIRPAELGVRCESCHGPGAEHIQAGGAKYAIQNPRRLTPAAMNDSCGACHRKPSGDATDWSDAWNTRHQPIYLSQSPCFKKSEGRMSCLTCHDAHSPVVREAKSYDAKCSECHSGPKHRTDVSGRSCIGCHMPEVKPNEYLSFANHWIGIYGMSPLRTRMRAR